MQQFLAEVDSFLNRKLANKFQKSAERIDQKCGRKKENEVSTSSGLVYAVGIVAKMARNLISVVWE